MTLRELRQLHERSTPPPWTEDDGNVFSKPLSDRRHDIIMKRVAGDKSTPHPDAGKNYPLGFVASTHQHQERFDEDARLIVGARNVLDDLLAIAEHVAGMEPLDDRGCYFCGTCDNDHEDDCAWLRARRLKTGREL